MKLANPVDKFIPRSYPDGDVTQWYGENKALYSSVCNAGGCLTGGHNGIDIVRPWGTPIFCVESGIVVEALGKETGFGTHVKVLSDTGFEWTYAHLSAIDVNCRYGERIERGQLIGKMGNTGFVVSGATPFWKENPYAGTHLHLGKRKVRPREGNESWSVTYFSGTAKEYRGVVENVNNGTIGALPILAEDFEGFVSPAKPQYTFKKNLEYGMTDPDIKALQDILKHEGLMPSTIPSTGGYFEQTRKAVLAFQKMNGLITPFQELTYRGKYVYEITRTFLNRKYGGAQA